MKTLIVPALFSLTILGSCNQPQENKDTATTEKGNSKQEEMLKGNREVMHAIETGDSATINKYIADDATDHGGGPNGTDMKGKEIHHMLSNIHNDIDNMKMEIIQEAANNDYVFCLSRMTGTTKKPVWGMPANYKIDMQSVDVVKISNNKMTDHWTYMNPADMMKMMPPSSAANKGSATPQ